MTTNPIPTGQPSPHSVHRAHPSRRRAVVVLLAACIMAYMSGLAHAQFAADAPTEFDGRWLPWMGCWQLVEETGQPADIGRELPFAGRALACVAPAEESGAVEASAVTLTSITEGEPIFQETLRADGRQHPVNEPECSGWRQNTWSADGARIFTRAELDCGTQDTRIVSGLGLMPNPSTWLDLELIDAGGYGVVTIRRYRRASNETTADLGATPLSDELSARVLSAARIATTVGLSLDDAIEAGQHVEPAVLEALIVETRPGFALDAQALLQLADGGVSPDVIDLMVALAFPDQFVVNRSIASPPPVQGGAYPYPPTWAGYGRGYGYEPWYSYYSSPFGYYYGAAPYSSLSYWGGPASTYFIGRSFMDGGLAYGGTSRRGSAGEARAYQGRGYARVTSRPPASNGSGRGRSIRGIYGGGSSVSSSGGQATPDGHSGGGGGGGDSGRTAVAR